MQLQKPVLSCVLKAPMLTALPLANFVQVYARPVVLLSLLLAVFSAQLTITSSMEHVLQIVPLQPISFNSLIVSHASKAV